MLVVVQASRWHFCTDSHKRIEITHSQEKVADIVGNVDSQTNIGKVEAVAKTNERQTDEMVADELVVVLARRLQAQDHDHELLCPVGGLEEVVELEHGLVGHVREVLVHARRVKVPHGSAAHNVHAPGPNKAKVDGRVHLLHEAVLLALGLEACEARQGTQQLLHDELAGKGQDNGIKGHKGKVPWALAILRRCVWGGIGVGG